MTDQQTTDAKPACGTIKELEVKSEAQGIMPGASEQQRPGGLQAMTERDINDYMATLLESKQPPPGMATLELGALAQYRAIAQQQGNTERRLTRAQTELEALKAQISRLQGQSEAYVNLLVIAEDTRRAEAKTKVN